MFKESLTPGDNIEGYMVLLLCWMAVNQFECHKIILCAIYLWVSKFFGKITLAWKDKKKS
jgi:hypothetical protein